MVGLLKLTFSCKAVLKHPPVLRIAILRYCSFMDNPLIEFRQGRRRWVGRVGRVGNYPPRFWQISVPYFNQRGQTVPPHLYLPTQL